MTTSLAETTAHEAPPMFVDGVERLLAAQHPTVTPRSHRWLIDAAHTVGLLGRGGAAFPVAAKLGSVGHGAHVVVNGSEGEPSSWKDRTLMRHRPDLIVDGALLVGNALSSPGITIAVSDPASADALATAARLRQASEDIRILRCDNGFVGGEAAALVNSINGRPAVPNGQRVLPSERGVHDGPTFLSNAETFAQLALLAALGPQQYAAVGIATEPGTTLVTVHDPNRGTGVVETQHGRAINSLVTTTDRPLLIGGYHGTWVPAQASHDALIIDRLALRARGITWGAGVVAALPDDTCELGEIARVAHWLADQSAGQCGPCIFGLASIANDLSMLADGHRIDVDRVRHRLGVTDGRGACSHPSGAVRFVASGMTAYAAELHRHEHSAGCGRPVRGALPIGPLGPAINGGPR